MIMLMMLMMMIYVQMMMMILRRGDSYQNENIFISDFPAEGPVIDVERKQYQVVRHGDDDNDDDDYDDDEIMKL